MKKMIIAGLLCLTALTATGCGAEYVSEEGNTTSRIDYPIMARAVITEDGRTVQCIYMFSSVGSALSCDWENAK